MVSFDRGHGVDEGRRASVGSSRACVNLPRHQSRGQVKHVRPRDKVKEKRELTARVYFVIESAERSWLLLLLVGASEQARLPAVDGDE